MGRARRRSAARPGLGGAAGPYRELELRLGSASRIVGVVLDDATDRPLAVASVRRAAGAEARLHPHPRRAGGYRVELTRSRGLDEVCDARIYVDGMAYGLADDETVDDIVSPTAVEILEVYRSPAELPIEFGGSQDRCDVVAVWTRRGG